MLVISRRKHPEVTTASLHRNRVYLAGFDELVNGVRISPEHTPVR